MDQCPIPDDQIKGADLFVECLRQYGVREIFGVPGEANPDFMLALLNQQGANKIQFITTRHEQAAAFMAYGVSKVNLNEGKYVPGVCLSTEGPGATNLLTAIACANFDNVPLIAITGQAKSTASFKRGFQVINVIGTTKPVTRWSITVSDPENIVEILAEAFRRAYYHPFGVVHIELPTNVAAKKIPRVSPIKLEVGPKLWNATEEAIGEAFDAIVKATKPVILVGPGISYDAKRKAWDRLREFVKKTKIPTVVAPGGKGALPESDDNYCYALNFPDRDWANVALESADLLICIGYDPAEIATGAWNGPPYIDPPTPTIHIAKVPATIEHTYPVKCEVIGDIAHTLINLIKLVEQHEQEHPGHHYSDGKIQAHVREKFKQSLSYAGEKVKEGCVFQGTVCNEVNKFMRQHPEEALIVLDSGFHQIWMLRNSDFDDPKNLISSNAMASMGVGLPAALGAARAAAILGKKKKILVVTGDGGFMMNQPDMATIKKLANTPEGTLEGVQVVVLVWNDSALGFVEWAESGYFGGASYDLSFDNPNFEALGNAFQGWKGFPEITKKEHISATLEKAFTLKESVLVSVKLDKEQNNKFSAYLKNSLDQPPAKNKAGNKYYTLPVAPADSYSRFA